MGCCGGVVQEKSMMEIRDIPFQFATALRSFSFPKDYVIEEAKKRLSEMRKVHEGYDAAVKETLEAHRFKADEKTLARLDQMHPYGALTPELKTMIRQRTLSRSLGVLIKNLDGFVRYATHSKVTGIGTLRTEDGADVPLNLDECRSMLEPFDRAAFEEMFRRHDPDELQGITGAMARYPAPMPAMAALGEPAPFGIAEALSDGGGFDVAR